MVIDPPPRLAELTAGAPKLVEGVGDLALVLSGGGARGAYQVGVLRYLARRFPDLRIPYITGVSAGAVNATHLAQHHGTFAETLDELTALWLDLLPEKVFRVDPRSLSSNVMRTGVQLVSGGRVPAPNLRGMVDTEPLRQYLREALCTVDGELTGIDANLEQGRLRALALITTSYTTGQTVVWVQGRQIQHWERPMRRSVPARITIDHIMASTALPLLFPAVQIGTAWYGDGGIRLSAPLSPALHLGAEKILTISTHYIRSDIEADRREVEGYPPPAQVVGLLFNAVFLDLVDQDAMRMERLNRVLRGIPEEQRDGMRPVELLVLRPSCDLGMLASEYEPRLPRAFRFLSRGLGTRKTRSSDLMSMVMFQPDYLRRLIELGEADAAAREAEILDFIAS